MKESIAQKITSLNQTTLESLDEADNSMVIQRFTQTGLEILGADFGFAWWKADSGTDYTLVYKTPTTPYDPNLPRKQGGNYIAQKNQAPVFVSAVKKEDYDPEYDVSPYMASYAIIPVCYKNNIYGNLVLCFKQPKIFSEEDESLSTALGNAAAQAITMRLLMENEQNARNEAESQKARFQALIEHSYDAIALIDALGKILDVSQSTRRISGYDVLGLVGRNIKEFIHYEDMAEIDLHMQNTLQNPGVAHTIEFRYLHKDGSWRWFESTGVNMLNDPNVSGIVVNIRDITERKQIEEAILHQALHDPLTNLPNRQEMSARLDLALQMAKRNNHMMAVLFLDFDHFKKINDGLGHGAGDMLLKVAAHRFRSCVRAEDTVARLGGDEFVIILNEIRSSNDAVLIADKILKAISLPVKIADHNIHATASIGISVYPQDGQDVDSLKKSADVALYRAKEAGRNRFRLYDSSMQMYAKERLAMENELRQALELGQIVLYYQPIISLKNHRVIAVEALARWQHPTRGLVLPNEFIPLAEETGLISVFGEYVLRAACGQIKSWQEMGLPKFRVAVNVSAKKFSESTFISHLTALLREFNVEPNNLELEITESLAMNDLELTSANLKLLKKMGVYVTIDDFGTGYSSLNYLKNFSINNLKIDKSFIRHCITSGQDGGITRTIIAMAHNLNLKVIAEGVETRQQLDFLASLGCNYAQGFFIHKPMPPEQLPLWLEKAKGEKVASGV